MILVLMGVTASGKTTVGQRLAQRLEWPFVDGDDYHSQANREKMTAAIPLTDDDRAPWLAELHGLLEDWEDNGINGVIACSALKEKYRAALTDDIETGLVTFVWLDAPRGLLEERAAVRDHAFMASSLLDSQLETLELPESALHVRMLTAPGGQKTVDEIVAEILTALRLTPAQD